MQFNKHPVTRAYFALSDFTRIRVVRLLATAARRGCLSDLSAALQVPAPQLSKHVHVLAWAGILGSMRDGRRVWLNIRNGDPQVDYLQASLLALPDSGGQFAVDLARFEQELTEVS